MDTRQDGINKAVLDINEGVYDLEDLLNELSYKPTQLSLGQSIKTVVDNFSVKNNAGVETQIRLSYDFSTSSDTDIKSWLCGNRRISVQRPMRTLSSTEIKALDGTVINALDCGKKVKSRDDRINELKAAFMTAGVDEGKATELATAAVDNPKVLAIVNEV